MAELRRFLNRPSLHWLLAFVPVSIAAGLSHQQVVTFVTSVVA